MVPVYRITVLTGSLNGAGAEKTLLTLCESFAFAGHQVHLVTLRSGGDYPIPDAINHHVAEGNTRKEQMVALEALTAVHNADLFITSKPEFYDAIPSIQRICTVHNTLTEWIDISDRSRAVKWLNRTKLALRYQRKQLVVLSEGIRQDLINNLGCHNKNIHLIPNPYHFDKIESSASQPGALPEGKYILYVASLIRRKRHEDLLRAYAESKTLRTYKLVLVGKGDQEKHLQALAGSLGIADDVIFWGWDANPYRLIRHASLAVLVSEAEGMPRALVEALIIGTPVIATDCRSGPAEIMTGALSEYLVPVGDIPAIRQAMEKAISAFPAETGFDRERFDAARVAARYLSFCEPG